MKKGQFLLVALCASAMVLGGCGKSSKKKTSSSSSSAQPTTSSEPTSSSSSSEAPVVVNVESVSLDQSSLANNVGDKEVKLKATVLPENATNKNVTWSSSDPSVADVENGYVSFLKAGSATITVTTVDGSKTATCTVTVSQPWSADDLAIFEEHIYGVHVPYYAVEGAEVVYDSETEKVVYGTPDSVLEPNCTPDLLDAYAALFPDEWELEPSISEEVGYEEYYYSGKLEVEITIAEQPTLRYVYVEIGAYTADGEYSKDGNGFFYMDLYDPNYYSWAEFAPALDELTNALYEVPSLVPAYTGELFDIELNLQYFSQKAFYFYISDVVLSEYQSYESSLKTNENWVFDGIDAEYGWTEFHRADSKFALYIQVIEYAQDPGYGYVVGLIMPYYPDVVSDEWPTKYVSDFINGAEGKTEIVLPAFDGGEGAEYNFEDVSEDYGYAELAISGGENCTLAKLGEYATGLASNPDIICHEPTVQYGQTIYSFESKDHVFGYMATFVEDEDGDYVYFRIFRYNPLVDFPSASVVEFLATLEVEAAPFANISGASDDIYYDMKTTENGVVVYVMNVTSEEIATYLGGLSGWALNPVTENYVHESGKAKIVVYDYHEDGYFSLLFTSKSAAWEASEISAFEAALGGIVPPFLDAGIDYEFSDLANGRFFSGDMSAAELATYAAALLDTESETGGWSHLNSYSGYEAYYKAASDESGYAVMMINSNAGKYYFYLFFSTTEPVEDPTSWGEDEIAAFEQGLDGYVPPFFSAGLYESDPENHSFESEYFTYDDLLTYLGQLVASENFTYYENEEAELYFYYLQTENGYVVVTPVYDGYSYYITITFDVNPFPAEA